MRPGPRYQHWIADFEVNKPNSALICSHHLCRQYQHSLWEGIVCFQVSANDAQFLRMGTRAKNAAVAIVAISIDANDAA